jgi:hypothetical protein
MNNIQFLGEEAVHQLLVNLTKDEPITFRNAIEQTFEDFSVVGERQYHQPDPSSATRLNGQRTLFRPFTSDSVVGAKLVVESAPGSDCKRISARRPNSSGWTRIGEYEAVLPTVKGSAWIDSVKQMVLDESDPWPVGFRVG